MKFEYLPVVQRSPEWFDIRRGKITASRLCDWLAVSSAKGKEGVPLKARLDYERELWFERKFGVAFNNYVSEAMLDGQEFEAFAADQYSCLKGISVEECGIWFSAFFAASPDRTIGSDGLLEVKVVRDNTFTEILLTGVPEKHYKQIQGQLWATGRTWCDYVALNLNTKKIAIWRVEPNFEFQKQLEESVQAELTVEDVATNEVYDIQGKLPDFAQDAGTMKPNIGGMDQW